MTHIEKGTARPRADFNSVRDGETLVAAVSAMWSNASMTTGSACASTAIICDYAQAEHRHAVGDARRPPGEHVHDERGRGHDDSRSDDARLSVYSGSAVTSQRSPSRRDAWTA